MRLCFLFASVLLVGCGGKSDDSTATTGTATGGGTGSGTGGAATGSGTGTGTGGTTDVVDVMVLTPDASCGPDPGGQTLDLTGQPGRIDVVHIGVEGSVCADWEVTAVATLSEWRIDVTYTDVQASTCGTPCFWTIDYLLNELPEGDWTVNADLSSETVTVLP